MKFQKWVLILLSSVCACTNKGNSDEKILQEAALVHNEMIALAGQLEAHLTNMESDTIGTVSGDSIRTWKSEIEAWEEEIVEVPGNEENTGHKENEEHHHHDHKKVEVTPQQMLIIQQELRRKIVSIRARVESALKK